MTVVVCEISVSVDGFVTGPDPGPSAGLGRGGEALHRWAMDGDEIDREVLGESTARSGAVVMGRRLFDIVDAPDGWNEDMGYGADHAEDPPFFVVTHAAPPSRRLQDLDFTFVTEGVAAAVDAARLAAGGRDVVVMGGGDVIRQIVDAGLADELRLHVSPILLGAGTPLFVDAASRELVQREVRVSSTATHLVYDLAGPRAGAAE